MKISLERALVQIYLKPVKDDVNNMSKVLNQRKEFLEFDWRKSGFTAIEPYGKRGQAIKFQQSTSKWMVDR